MTTNKRLLELDCLRGLAALMVVFFHFGMQVPYLKFSSVLRFGSTGVDLFFMISGFVIFLTLNKTADYKDFLISRFARLYPVYWACVTITALLIFCNYYLILPGGFTLPRLSDYLANLTMLQYYFKVSNLDGPYWTLIIELLFYVFMLIIFLLKKLDKIENIGLAAVSLSIVNELVFKKYVAAIYLFLNGNIPLISHIPLFIAGIVFYKIKFDKNSVKRSLLLALCIINQIGLYNYAGLTHTVMSRVEYMIIICLFYALFMLYSYDRLGFIVNKPLLFLGKISYSLYLIHQYLSVKVLLPWLTSSQSWQLNYWLAAFGIVLPVIIFSAALINKFIEAPAMVYIKRRF